MTTLTLLVGAALSCSGAGTDPSHASAQRTAPAPASNGSTAEPSGRATNQALLEALLERRARAAQAVSPPAGKAAALEFLDRQIAKVRQDLGE